MSKRIGILFVVTIILIAQMPISRVGAADWVDNIIVYSQSMTIYDNIRNITNNSTNSNQLTVTIASVQNISMLSSYILDGNETRFIEISDGAIIIGTNSITLLPNETIAFNISAKPVNNATAGSVAVVAVTVTLASEATKGFVFFTIFVVVFLLSAFFGILVMVLLLRRRR